MTRNWFSFWGLLALLFAECEYLLRMPEHEAVRVALRGWVGFPAHDILFATIAMLVLAVAVMGERMPKFEPSSFSGRLVLLHLGYVALLDTAMLPLHELTSTAPYCKPIWLPILAGFFFSWLACLVRPHRWLEIARCWWRWWLFGLGAGCLSIFLSKALARCWYALPTTTLWATERWLRLFFDHVVVDRETCYIGCKGFGVKVYAFCSGYEGMALIACYVFCYLWLKREQLKFPLALALLPVSMLLSFAANSVRLALLVTIGALVSPELANEGFHFRAGWLTFVLLGVALVVLVERQGWLHKERVPRRSVALPYLMPLLVLLISMMVTLTFSGDFDFYYPLRVMLVIGVLLQFRQQYSELFGPVSSRSLWCGLGVYVLWIALAAPSEGTNPATQMSGLALSIWLGFRVLGSVVVVPLVEELAFRGYLLRRLQGPNFESVPIGSLNLRSVVVSSLCFGLLHQSWLAGFAAGVSYALVIRNRGSLSDAVVAHGVTNLCLAVQVVALGTWGYW